MNASEPRSKVRDLVLVTAANSSYFHSLLTLINTHIYSNPGTEIELDIWDLGLSQVQVNLLNQMTIPNIKIRKLHDFFDEPFEGAFSPEGECFAWKAHCVQASLATAESIFWIDAGVAISGSIEVFLSQFVQPEIILFSNEDHLNGDWLSKECSRTMNVTTEELSENQIMSSVVFFSNTSKVKSLISEWVRYSAMESAILSDELTHRHDQSILSILALRFGFLSTPSEKFLIQSSDYQLASSRKVTFLQHRRTYNWWDLNMLIEIPALGNQAKNKVLTIVTVCLDNPKELILTAESFEITAGIEWLVIDGGSNSENLTEIEQIVKNFNGKLIYGPDSGVFNAMNKALRIVQSDYILFLNSGDHFAPDNKLAELIDYLKASSPDWAIGETWGVSNGKLLWRWPVPGYLRLYLGINSYNHQTMVLSKQARRTIGLYDETSLYSDWSPTIKLQRQFGAPIFLPNFRVHFDTNGASSRKTLRYWIKESSRLRVRDGVHFLKSERLDLLLQKITGLFMRTKFGKRFRYFSDE